MFALGETEAGREQQNPKSRIARDASLFPHQQVRARKQCARQRKRGEGEDECLDDRPEFRRKPGRACEKDGGHIDQKARRRIGIGNIDIGLGAVDDALGEQDEPAVVAVEMSYRLLRDRERDDERRQRPRIEEGWKDGPRSIRPALVDKAGHGRRA